MTNKIYFLLLASVSVLIITPVDVRSADMQDGAGVGWRVVRADRAEITCDVCAESKARREFDTLSCGHNYCNGCLDYMVYLAIKEKSTQALKCPDSECSSVLSEQDIRVITGDDAVKLGAYADITAQEWLVKQPDAKFCRTLGCSYAFLNEKNRRCNFSCPGCRKKYCTKCLFEHDSDLDCAEVVRGSVHDTEDIAWKRANTKPCPTCRAGIEKNEGCDYMKCSKCTTVFCWNCLTRVDHQSHDCSIISTETAHRMVTDVRLPKIINAAISDNIKLYNEAITEDADINTLGPKGNTPLILACENRSFEVAYRLLENSNTNVNIKNSDGDTALIIACRKGSLDIVSAIIECGRADLNVQNELGATALENACSFDHIEIVKLLLSVPGIDANLGGPLYTAISKKNIGLIRILLKHSGVDVTGEHFVLAGEINNIDVLTEILEHAHANINHQNSEGETALSMACKSNNIEIVKLLLANPEIDVNLGGPLVHAVDYGLYGLINLILEHPGVDVNQQDSFGATALCKTIELNMPELSKRLLANPEIDVNLSAPLVAAAQRHMRNIIELLLENPRINVNQQDSFGRTALSAACERYENTKIIELLLAHPAIDVNLDAPLVKAVCNPQLYAGLQIIKHPNVNINQQNAAGDTALYMACACMASKFEIIESLLANPEIDVNLGGGIFSHGPLYDAIGSKNIELIKILLQQPGIELIGDHFVLAGAMDDARISRLILEHAHKNKFATGTTLWLACQTSSAEITKLLLANPKIDVGLDRHLAGAIKRDMRELIRLIFECDYANINRFNLCGKTALMCACESGNLEIVRLLLSRDGINVDAKASFTGDTALILAYENKRFLIAHQLLLKKSPKLTIAGTAAGSAFVTAVAWLGYKAISCLKR